MRTKPTNWQNTDLPIILPFSIYSAIYEGIAGDFTVGAFLQVVKSNVKGKITILLCDGAHLQTLCFECINAEEMCYHDANDLIERFNRDFQNCEVVHWRDFVTNDDSYQIFKDKIYQLYRTDKVFQSKVESDAEKNTNRKFGSECADRLYIDGAKMDLLEHCVYLLVASKKGYRFEFYPGKRNDCVNYINCHLLDDPEKLTRINVTLSSPKNPT